MHDARNPFSEKEDVHLVKFLARHNPEARGRLGQAIYQQLVENADNKWPWAKSHTWQSWRERYKKNQDAFDRKIRLLLKRQQEEGGVEDDEQEGPSTRTSKPERRKNTLFTDSDDEHLAEFLATRGSDMGRLGNSLYKVLEAEAETLPWAKRHPWQSWRERYKKHRDVIEDLVSNYEGEKRVKKEKTGRAEPSVQAPQAASSKSREKERQTAIPPEASSKAPHASSSNSKGKENPTSTTSSSKGKAKQKDDEAPQDRSTHVEMRQERTAGPAKNQRVQSATPAPGPKASQPKAPPPPSANGKGKQKEIEPQALRVQETPLPVPLRDISIPPIEIKSQEASDGDSDMHSLFGSDDEELEIDELEESQSQNKVPPRAKPAAPPPPKKDPAPERVLVPSSSQIAPPSSPDKPLAPPLSAVQPLRKKHPVMKLVTARMAKRNENIFVSSDEEPSSPSPSPSPSPPRPAKKSSPRKRYSEAPKIVEGPYRSQLKRVRSRIESDSDEAPPKRARRNPETDDSQKKSEKMQVDAEEKGLRQQQQTKENINPDVVVAPMVKKGPTQLHHARKSASQNVSVARAPAPTHEPMVVSPPAVATPPAVEPRPSAPRREVPKNAIASTSRVRLSDIPPVREETPVIPTTTPAFNRRSKPPANQLSLPRKETPVPSTATPAHTGRNQPPAPGLSLPSLEDSVIRHRPSQSRNTEYTIQKASPRRDSGVIISPGAKSEADFFNAPLHISSAGNSKGKEREYALDVRPPRIDLLRESLNRRRSQIHSVRGVARTDSRTSSAASNLTTSESRASAAVAHNRQARMSVASEDAVSALLEWMPPLIDMAAEYNVADSVVVKLFKRLMSMEKTEVVLFAQSCDLTEEEGLKAYKKKKTVARAKEALALFAQSKKMFEEDVSSGSGEEEMPSGLALRSLAPSASVAKVERRESGANAQAQASSAKRRRSRPSLIIRRIPTDQDVAMSDYIPPKNSRAGQYARLQKQGRVAEAKEREMNRILITETQTQYVPVRMHSPTVSPSPHTRLQVQEVSQVIMDDDAMRIDENHHEERGHDEGQEAKEDEQEQHDNSDEHVYVDAEEESQRDDVVMMESSEDEDLGAQASDGSVAHAVDDEEEEQGEEVEEDGDVEQPSDTEEDDEEQEEEQAMAEEEQEEPEGEDSEDAGDAEVGEQQDEEDNGIFGSRESEDEPEEQYSYERGTSTTNSDFDRDESRRPSSRPPHEDVVEEHPGNNVTEENDFAQNSGIIDEDEDDIYMPESLEMPYPGQPQRYEESQEDPEAEPEAEAPPQSSSSHMQPSSLPSLLTFGSGGPDKNPAFADIAKRHRQLTLNATAENYQELKDFEEKHSDKSDLMRLWSIKWAKALMQHNATDNEES